MQIVLNKRKDVLIAILGSNCGGKNHRWDYVKELEKHIKVDVYGGCGNLKTLAKLTYNNLLRSIIKNNFISDAQVTSNQTVLT